MGIPHHLAATPIVQVLMGLLLLCLGRKLFWLFVGVIGFFAGAHFGQELAAGQPEMVLFVIAVVVGLFGALLAIFLQYAAVILAGGVAGGMLAMRLGLLLGFTTQPMEVLCFVVGAILAAILIATLFDWALIILSAATGAMMVVEVFGLGQPLELVAWAVLVALGIGVQARQLRAAPPEG